MSTSAEVSAAWASQIAAHTSVTAFSSKIYNFDAIDDRSETALSRFKDSQQISFIQYLTVRSCRFRETADRAGGAADYTFEVQVSAFREADLSGSNWAAVRDFFDTLLPLVNSQLGNTWSGTVDYWTPDSGAPALNQILIDNTPTWRGTFSYFGHQRVNF